MISQEFTGSSWCPAGWLFISHRLPQALYKKTTQQDAKICHPAVKCETAGEATGSIAGQSVSLHWSWCRRPPWSTVVQSNREETRNNIRWSSCQQRKALIVYKSNFFMSLNNTRFIITRGLYVSPVAVFLGFPSCQRLVSFSRRSFSQHPIPDLNMQYMIFGPLVPWDCLAVMCCHLH